MFKLSSSYWQKVTIEVPTQEGGTREIRIDVNYNRIPREQIDTIIKDAEGETPVERDTDVMMKIASDWRGVTGDDGELLEWSRENVQKFVSWGFGFPVVQKLFASMPKAKEKN
jgi:hypothetical protein